MEKAINIIKEYKSVVEKRGMLEYYDRIDEALNVLISLKNRTCDSCKFFEADMWESGKGSCRNKQCVLSNYMVPCDFCCNQYIKGIRNVKM